MTATEIFFVVVMGISILLFFVKPARRGVRRVFDDIMLDQAIHDRRIEQENAALAREVQRMLRSGVVKIEKLAKCERALGLSIGSWCMTDGRHIPSPEMIRQSVRKYQALLDASGDSVDVPADAGHPAWLLKPFEYDPPKQEQVDWSAYSVPTYLRARNR